MKEKGITLVALVVTIVVLIILAVISLNIVFNEGGILDRVEKAREYQANAEVHDDERLGTLDNIIKEYMNGNIGYIDSELINSPKLAEGMIPVKWNGTNWVKTTANDSNWYNYANKEWANIVLSDSTFHGDILDESKPYSQLVWIPRFAYKITDGWHSTETGTIEVVFVGIDNKGKDGTVYGGSYSDAVAGITSGGAMKNFVVQPAFDYGETKLEGFWMGKYESSHTSCTTNKTTGEVAFTGNEVMQVKPNVTSWRNITIGNVFTTCLNMNKEGNPYGLSSNDNVVDPHMVKNTEWGAVAFLSKSKYGKETEEIFMNNSSNFVTGNAGNTVSATEVAGVSNAYDTVAGQKASTTGNIYGVYDMNGGNWEYVASYVGNGNQYLRVYGEALTKDGEAAKYREVYTIGTTDTQSLNYGKALIKYGDAIYETSNGYESKNESWYQGYSRFPYTTIPFFLRGGDYNDMDGAGVFAFTGLDGRNHPDRGFRTALSVL